MLTTGRIKRDFNMIFEQYPFKVKIKVIKRNKNYGNFFNIEQNENIKEYEFDAIINNMQPGAVKNSEYRINDEELSLFVKPRKDVIINFDDEIEYRNEKFVITYIGGAVDENNNRLWYEIKMKRKT